MGGFVITLTIMFFRMVFIVVKALAETLWLVMRGLCDMMYTFGGWLARQYKSAKEKSDGGNQNGEKH